MSGIAKNTLRDQPGPLDDSTECHHRGQLPQDPPTEYTQHCQQTAVFAVPHPNGLGQCLGLCPWHLARYLDAYPERRDTLATRFDLDDHVPETPWLVLDDLPSRTRVADEDDRWHLFALDQRGHAYYAPQFDGPDEIAVYATADWEHYDELIAPPDGASTRIICDHIADVHGLAALPDDTVAAITGGETDAE
jgi:hypothetical protein